MKLSVVILTGGRDGHQQLLAGTHLPSKVLLPVGGKPMVLSVFEAVCGANIDAEIFVSTNEDAIKTLETPRPFTVLPSESGAVQSIVRSLERVPGDGWVLFISGDHPLLTSEMIDYFVAEATQRKLTMGVAMVDRDLVYQYYPDAKRTFMPVKNGAFSGGNMYLINKKEFVANERLLETVDRNRKQHWKTLFSLGFSTVLLTVLRLIDIHQLGKRFSKTMGCKVGAVEMPWPECCMDVDKVVDRELAETILENRRQGIAPRPVIAPKPATVAANC